MKLRFKDNSIRLRLSADEVDLLESERIIQCETSFGAAMEPFRYGIQIVNVVEIEADLKSNTVLVSLPPHVFEKWAESPQVGIDYRMGVGNGKFLRILVEKDFACLQKNDLDDDLPDDDA
ncbi:MAG: hypothetical protein GC193_15135 [Cryomorphaceae bacterium]|nr:hypothetical protein [Cryomorphaceae bacterium]